ncbi:MAG: hypothetical protein IT289_09845 [Oligoflexia bacterium]|nr:hypothetical protein [Oligoflexia bacterium]
MKYLILTSIFLFSSISFGQDQAELGARYFGVVGLEPKSDDESCNSFKNLASQHGYQLDEARRGRDGSTENSDSDANSTSRIQ